MRNLLTAFFLIFGLHASAGTGGTAAGRIANDIQGRQGFDFGWKFCLADDAAYSRQVMDDSQWQDVQLPHDWSTTLDFDKSVSGSSGHLPGGIAWYRKTFSVPATWQGKRVAIHFDGIYHQSDVYVNGHHLGFRPYGFCSQEYDLTPYLQYGKDNVLAVRVDRKEKQDVCRWYTGAGIYRHAWLMVRDAVHIPTYGTYITTPEVTERKATAQIVTTLYNTSGKLRDITVAQTIVAPGGKVVAKGKTVKQTLQPGDSVDVSQSVDIASPELWSLESPRLYTLVTTLKSGGKTVDSRRTRFGIRTLKFDPEHGFFLNGKHVKLKGMALHQDMGCLGTAIPDRGYEYRLNILKEYGCNAVRCAHNQPSPELIDICDSLGLLVIDEAFDKWKSGYYAQYFDQWWQCDLSDMILRDRNHPSIIMWSIGNELQEAWDGGNEGIERAKMLNDFVHRLEPSRPTTLAAQNNHNGRFSAVPDISGYNYLEARLLSDRARRPDHCFFISEELPYYQGAEGNIRAYLTDNPWNTIAAHDFILGGFIWSGVDYWGESGGNSHGWPNGLFDTAMDEKPRAAFHRAMWNLDKPTVGLAVMDNAADIDHGRDLWQWPSMVGHWSFPWRYDGLMMEVRTTTNCDSVLLVCNGKEMGVRRTSDFPNHTISWHIPYTPGTLEARAYKNGTVAATKQLVTAHKATRIEATADRTLLKADGQDLVFVKLRLTDDNGNTVEVDDRRITVSVSGEGLLRGIDTGETRRTERLNSPSVKSYFGRAQVVVQATRKVGKVEIEIKADGIDNPCTLRINTKLSER